MITSVRSGDVASITIRRDERRNALDVAHCRDLQAAVEGAVEEGCRALLIAGEGASFCAGADLDTVTDERFLPALYAMLGAISKAPVVSIAAIDGAAIGAGTQLAIACDLRVCTPRSTFGVPTARYGLAVDPWSIERLTELAGGALARSMLLGCSMVDGPEALRRGLVDRMGVPDDAASWANEIAGLAPMTLRYSKRVLDAVQAGSAQLATANLTAADPAAAAATAEFDAVWASQDLLEGQRARAEQRAPRFEGR